MRIFFLVVLLVSSGCATLPRTGAPATGEPLAVKTDVLYSRATVREKVGTVEHRDSGGRNVGTSELYEDRQVINSHLVWATYQGGSVIDEEDFFRIAGDTSAADSIRRSRHTGLWLNRAGWGAAVGFGLLAVGGYAMAAQSNGDSTAPRMLMIGGLLGVSGGAYLAYIGKAMVDPQRRHNSMGTASVTAAEYNARLRSDARGPEQLPGDAPLRTTLVAQPGR
jgi:hypothetical protein